MEFEIENDELSEFADTDGNYSSSQESTKAKKKYKRRIKPKSSSEDDQIEYAKKRRKLSKVLEGKLTKAQKYYLKEKFPEAIELLLEVVKQKPNFHIPYVTLSMIHEEMGDVERSLSYLLLAAQIAENDGEIWGNVAYKSRELGNIRQALYCYKKAILFHEGLDFVWDLALLLQEIGDFRGSIKQYKKILAVEPLNPKVIEEIANIHIHSFAEMEKGEQLLYNFVKHYLDNNDLENVDLNVANLLIELRISQSNYDSALDIINKLVKVLKEIPIEIHINRGICVSKLGNIELASKLFETLLSFSIEEYGDLYQTVGETYIELEEYTLAKKYLSKIINLEPETQGEIYYLLGKCDDLLNNKKQSIYYFKKSLELIPSYHKPCIKLARNYMENKDFQQALEITSSYINFVDVVDFKIILVRLEIFRELDDFNSYMESIEYYVSSEYLQSFTKVSRKYTANKENLESESESEIEVDELHNITDQVLGEDGESLFKFASKPKVPKSKIDNTSLNEKKDDFLSKLFDDGILYTKALFKKKEYEQVRTLIGTITNLSDRPFVKSTSRSIYLQFLTAIGGIATGEYNISYILLRSVIWNRSSDLSNWKLFSFVLAKGNILTARTYTFIATLLSRDGLILPAILLYGLIFLASGFYYRSLRAFLYASIHYPDNPLVHLYTGISCLCYSVHRNIENRNQLVLLGFTYLSKYYKLRSNIDEANYNLGRGFQQLGLDHHAITYYEKVLSSDINNNPNSGRNYKKPAAYNLALIYKKSGSNALAINLLQNYLTY